MLRIPKAFKLFGQTIAVEWVHRLTEEQDAVGEARFRKNCIVLQQNNEEISRPQTQIEATFCHELVHWIFFMMDEDDLRKNEKLVDNFGRLLHQALTTMEYETESPTLP